MEKLKTGRVKITTPDPAPFREAAKPVYDKFLTSEADKKLLKLVSETR